MTEVKILEVVGFFSELYEYLSSIADWIRLKTKNFQTTNLILGFIIIFSQILRNCKFKKNLMEFRDFFNANK